MFNSGGIPFQERRIPRLKAGYLSGASRKRALQCRIFVDDIAGIVPGNVNLWASLQERLRRQLVLNMRFRDDFRDGCATA
jgi:hypothetical protein